MAIAEELKELAVQKDLLSCEGMLDNGLQTVSVCSKDMLGDGLPTISIYSKDKKYRYAFACWWGEGSLAFWVLLNPTTRDIDGGQRRSLRRCINWSRSWGRDGLIIGNLFALRENNPGKVRKVADDPIGPQNDAVLKSLTTMADCTIVAWGHQSWLNGRQNEVFPLLREPECLGMTKSGEPRHPSRVPKKVSRQLWRPRQIGRNCG